MRSFALIALASLALGTFAVAPAAAEIDGERFSSEEWRVSLTAPKSWQLTEQTSYPNILLWMVRHNPDGKILLSAEPVGGDVDAQAYATRTSQLLEKVGFKVRPPQLHSSTGAYWLELDNGSAYLRQAFLVSDGIGYTLTMSAPDARTRAQHLRAFDYVLRSIRLKR